MLGLILILCQQLLLEASILFLGDFLGNHHLRGNNLRILRAIRLRYEVGIGVLFRSRELVFKFVGGGSIREIAR